ncbi:MAG: hybrid sensor histidine kinase/response regulator [bacterium]|nr:hybrid sensor histidine kinase/response regulator [bacterium]
MSVHVDVYKPLVFIVDDVPKNLQVLCNILRKKEYRIAAATNGKQALEMIPEVRPDLILLDVMMPEMDGFQVCEKLQENPDTRDIPIIFLTARTGTADVVKGLEAGAVDYVTKPFNGAELLSRVHTHLELKLARESLKDANAAKDRFFSIIAHDLKNPLQVLLLYADSLHNNYDSIDEIRRKEYFKKFYGSTLQITALLENLLTWALSQRGRIERNPEKISITTLVEENCGLLKGNAEKKNITLSNLVEENTFAYADRNMIGTVLRNLISNAVKFTGQDGAVSIRTSTTEDAGSLEIIVSDTGVGIAPNDVNRLFRLDVYKTTRGTEDEKGTGLGLLLCKEFIRKNKGTIEASSTPGEGSEFIITLPTTEDTN